MCKCNIDIKSLFSLGDEVLEWNSRSLVGKSYDEVHDVIAESRHEPQVELRVSRAVHPGANPAGAGGPMDVAAAMSTSGGGVAGGGGLGLTTIPPSHQSHHPGGGPAVTLSDPLGGTLMLNPLHSSGSAASAAAAAVAAASNPLATRIQVGHSKSYH